AVVGALVEEPTGVAREGAVAASREAAVRRFTVTVGRSCSGCPPAAALGEQRYRAWLVRVVPLLLRVENTGGVTGRLLADELLTVPREHSPRLDDSLARRLLQQTTPEHVVNERVMATVRLAEGRQLPGAIPRKVRALVGAVSERTTAFDHVPREVVNQLHVVMSHETAATIVLAMAVRIPVTGHVVPVALTHLCLGRPLPEPAQPIVLEPRAAVRLGHLDDVARCIV